MFQTIRKAIQLNNSILGYKYCTMGGPQNNIFSIAVLLSSSFSGEKLSKNMILL